MPGAPPGRSSEGGAPARVAAVLRRSPILMGALRAAREVDAPSWLIAAGAVRDAVWDAAHHRSPGAPRDVDLVFHDPANLTRDRDEEVQGALAGRLAALVWDAKNQAAVHLWYPERFGRRVSPLRSAADGVATWPETATCVGVRLLADDDLLVVAPHGLDDLLALVCRHNPTLVPRDVYEHRVAEKEFRSRWPKLRIG